jgi:hypothetical protein
MALTDATFGDSQAAEVVAAYGKKFGSRPDVLHALTGNGAQIVSSP